MKTDLYTKIVLTVIAIFLGLNFLKEIEIIPAAKANTTVTAQISQSTAVQAAPVDVNITHIGGVPLTNYKPEYSAGVIPPKEFNLCYGGIPVIIKSNWDK